MERPADDIFKVLDLDALRSPLPKHLFRQNSNSNSNNSNSNNAATNALEGRKENWQPPVLGKLPPVPAFNSSPAQTAHSPPVTIFKPKPIYAVPSSSSPPSLERKETESSSNSIILGGIQITPGRPSSTAPKAVFVESPATASLSETLNAITFTKEDVTPTPVIESKLSMNVAAPTSPLAEKSKRKRRILVQEEKPQNENTAEIDKSVNKQEKQEERLQHEGNQQQKEKQQQQEVELEEKQSGDEQRPKRRGRPPRKDKSPSFPSSPERAVTNQSVEAVYKNRIILLQWSLAVVPNSTKLTGIPLERLTRWIVLVGRRPDLAGEAWHSSIVTERITPGQICTGSGRSLYVLEGPMCTEDMHEHGFSEGFIAKFQRGFPEDWRECLMNELDRLEQLPDTPKTTPTTPVTLQILQIPKRKPGRPPKKEKKDLTLKEVSVEQEVKKEEGTLSIKRGPGRPRKNPLKEQSVQIPKKRGRKPKVLEPAKLEKEVSPTPIAPRDETSLTPRKGSPPKKETSSNTKVPSPTKQSPIKQQTSISPVIVRHSPRRSSPKLIEEKEEEKLIVEPVKKKKRGPGRPPKITKIATAEGEVIDVVTLEPTSLDNNTNNNNISTTPETPHRSLVTTGKKKRGRKPNKDKIYSTLTSTITSSVFKKERTIRTRRESTASPVIVKRLWGGKIGGTL